MLALKIFATSNRQSLLSLLQLKRKASFSSKLSAWEWGNKFLNSSTLEIAHKAKPIHIQALAKLVGIRVEEIQTYGNYAAHAQDDLSAATREWIAPCQTALASLTNWFFLEYLKGNVPNELLTPVQSFSETKTQRNTTTFCLLAHQTPWYT